MHGIQDGMISAPLGKRPSRLDQRGYQDFQASMQPARKSLEQRGSMTMLQRLKSMNPMPRKAPSAPPSRQQSHDSVESEVHLSRP